MHKNFIKVPLKLVLLIHFKCVTEFRSQIQLSPMLSLSLRWDAVSRKKPAEIHCSSLYLKTYGNDQTSLKFSGFQLHQMVIPLTLSIVKWVFPLHFSTETIYIMSVFFYDSYKNQCCAPKFTWTEGEGWNRKKKKSNKCICQSFI